MEVRPWKLTRGGLNPAQPWCSAVAFRKHPLCIATCGQFEKVFIDVFLSSKCEATFQPHVV